MLTPADVLKRGLSLVTDRIRSMPVLVLMPHSRCNCRCVMCDIWKGNRQVNELAPECIAGHVDDMRRLGVKRVVLSGGEALMHSDLAGVCEVIAAVPARITLLSTGLLLERYAAVVSRYCDEVIVSLDGAQETHDAIRKVPRAFERLVAGVRHLQKTSPEVRITARCVLQRANFADVPNIIDASRELGLAQVSFLAADLTSEAFNRPEAWDADRVGEVGLRAEDVDVFAQVIEQTLTTHREAFDSRFVAESADDMRRLVAYYRAQCGLGPFPRNRCNAPWVSTVVEADGSVRPCFFHEPLGSIHAQRLFEIVNSPEAIAFRRRLDVRTDPTCERCVCTLALGPLHSV